MNVIVSATMSPGRHASVGKRPAAGSTPLMLYVGFYTQGENRLHLDTPGRGHDDGKDRLLAGVLPMGR